ncbi:hypothetical protein PAXINDRAFT_18922 [Paxillus involutus ATCC 200175]|uniref:Zn(2)-C6 fungal-type domain-containing protein n=1 Tax=Paxillus involutus ATCC 200175 TaxID=664439 RepID=A0A0C9SNH0_PAXIN|nr:hypothetical protein PAXINDRAFT_18922 [Paxillus involutus ATCC 200175]
MPSSSEEIDPAELQREEEQHRREYENKIREAEEKRARREAEREKKRVAAEARKKAEEEARAKVEEEARRKAEEDEAKKKAEEEGRKQRQRQTTMIRPMDPEPGMSTAGSTRSSEWVPGFLTPCERCVRRKLACPGVRPPSKGKACHFCTRSHMSCREPGVRGSSKGSGKRTPIDLTSPRGGKDKKRRRQKSPDYRERKSDEEEVDVGAEEREDALGALVEAINGFTEQCREEWKAAAEYRENMTLELTGVRVALQTMARAHLDDRAERQEASGSGLGVRGSGEASGSKKVVDPKGKKRAVDEEVDVDIADEESDGDEEERDGEGDIEIV